MSRAIHELALPFYDVVDLPRDIALQAHYSLHLGVPLGHLLGDVFLGALIGPEPPYGDDVDRGVRLPTEATQCLRSALSGLPQDWATANRSDTAAAAVPKATYHAMLDRMENHAMRSLLLDALENPEQVQAMKEGLERAREIAKVEQEALEHALAGVGHELAKQDPHSPRRLSENTPEGRKNLYLLYQERLAVALYDRVEAGVWSLPESVDIHNEILDEGLPSNESAVERRRLRECAQQLADTFDLNRDFDLPILNGMGEPDSVRITPEQDPMRIAMARHPHKP